MSQANRLGKIRFPPLPAPALKILLGGSWVAISRVTSTLNTVITVIASHNCSSFSMNLQP